MTGQSEAAARALADVERYGGRRLGGEVGPAISDGERILWPWAAWHNERLVAGTANDRTNAFCALVHALDPDEAGQL